MMLPSIFSENMFDDFFSDSFDREFFGAHNPLYGKHAKNMMKTDIHEKENGYELAVELPGFKKDEINVDVSDGYLTIKAAKGLDKDENDKKGRVIRQERYAGVCSRSFYIGDVKPEDVKAKYESGVLTLEVPKAEAKKLPSSSSIAIE
ncbi:MAG TPA: heat-shock protein Hsp20 [Ruminococcaceae bacterium]|nr:heat-shock protein Hsp20 [Oscillospiraceae bacterium]